ncbi:GIY-YIG nuclease family protein [Haloferax denitrificans]|uniref:GIY-YIG nuclease family protein n=1 Tax=Haloferax denitrificans TaxID=35745 RepID=UPI0026C45CBD
MPPQPGRPFDYTRENIRGSVPAEAGVYWLRTSDGVAYIGESNNLQRRLFEHAKKDPLRFQYDTVKSYCGRYDLVNYPWKSPKWMAHKIENTELTLYEDRFGGLPPLNRKRNDHRTDVLESVIETVYREGKNWWP